MFAGLFKRAEASVDSAIGDLGNRILIAIPFIVAVGFGAASLALFAYEIYGPEIGNLIMGGAFVLLGCVIAIVVRMRTSSQNTAATETEYGAAEIPETSTQSIFGDEQVLGILSAAAPVVLPVMMRTASKNWPLIAAAAAGLYLFSRSDLTRVDPLSPVPRS